MHVYKGSGSVHAQECVKLDNDLGLVEKPTIAYARVLAKSKLDVGDYGLDGEDRRQRYQAGEHFPQGSWQAQRFRSGNPPLLLGDMSASSSSSYVRINAAPDAEHQARIDGQRTRGRRSAPTGGG